MKIWFNLSFGLVAVLCLLSSALLAMEPEKEADSSTPLPRGPYDSIPTISSDREPPRTSASAQARGTHNVHLSQPMTAPDMAIAQHVLAQRALGSVREEGGDDPSQLQSESQRNLEKAAQSQPHPQDSGAQPLRSDPFQSVPQEYNFGQPQPLPQSFTPLDSVGSSSGAAGVSSASAVISAVGGGPDLRGRTVTSLSQNRRSSSVSSVSVPHDSLASDASMPAEEGGCCRCCRETLTGDEENSVLHNEYERSQIRRENSKNGRPGISPLSSVLDDAEPSSSASPPQSVMVREDSNTHVKKTADMVAAPNAGSTWNCCGCYDHDETSDEHDKAQRKGKLTEVLLQHGGLPSIPSGPLASVEMDRET